MEELKVNAAWSDDCFGRKYDGSILSVSTRYWPRIVAKPGRPIRGNEVLPEIKPHAHSSILLRYRDDDGNDDFITLIDESFAGETQEEVQREVEAWAQTQFDKIVAVLAEHYKVRS